MRRSQRIIRQGEIEKIPDQIGLSGVLDAKLHEHIPRRSHLAKGRDALFVKAVAYLCSRISSMRFGCQ
jgi:hypothetical protein